MDTHDDWYRTEDRSGVLDVQQVREILAKAKREVEA
jgi:hypothetical protein